MKVNVSQLSSSNVGHLWKPEYDWVLNEKPLYSRYGYSPRVKVVAIQGSLFYPLSEIQFTLFRVICHLKPIESITIVCLSLKTRL